MVKIFAAGTPTVDYVYEVREDEALIRIATSLVPEPGGKTRQRDHEKFDDVKSALGPVSPELKFPGGSAPNTLIAMRLLLGDQFSSTLFTVLGSCEKSDFIRAKFYDMGINLAPGSAKQGGRDLRPAESIVFLFPDGERRIYQYPGNLSEHMKDAPVRPDLIREADAVILFGNVRETIGARLFDEILQIRWGDHVEPKMHTIPMWLSLPTNNQYSAANRDYFTWLAPSCNIVAGNETEIAAFAGSVGGELPVHDVASERAIAGRVLNGREGVRNEALRHKPIAFMTEGKDGATVVQDGFGRISVRPVSAKAVNTLAAGDVTTGTFYACISVGMNPAAAAQMAMSAGAITVEFTGTVPPDLATKLAVRDPENYEVFASLLARQRNFRERL